MVMQAMLTTVDNPYDPFDDYDEWYSYDERKGYRTPSFLARLVVSSQELSEVDEHLAIERAIDEIVKENITGLYKKVTREEEIKSVEI
jgi:hypothetical protein